MTSEAKKEYNRKYYLEHREKINEQKREHYHRNKEKFAEYRKQYYEKNKEKILENSKKYRKKYFQENKERLKPLLKKSHDKFIKKHNWSEYCMKAKRRRVERLLAQGVINPWSVLAGYEPKYEKVGGKVGKEN